MTFFNARSLGCPNIFRNSSSVEIIDFISVRSIPTYNHSFFFIFPKFNTNIV
ncbi:Phosphohydrolase (MutT/nudix family protein) [Bacillus thuringiensis BMB171]|nr:Phosphohydrolase (MutT/nudix family protein) [Bacillus thuringiensis BMB171]